MLVLKQNNPNIDSSTLIHKAHQQSRNIVNSITDKIKASEATRISSVVTDKKNASIDKGGTTNISGTISSKGKTITEIGNEYIKNNQQ